jgi:hypothetical protein
MCHELVRAGEPAAPNIIDRLFHWAAEQPGSNSNSVQIAITSNQISPTNIVSYARGSLFYDPGYSVETLHCSPSFASGMNGVTQYFSDRLYNTKAPFNAQDTDSLTVYISRQGIAATGYSITIKSARYGLSECFAPTFDEGSNVISGTIAEGSVFLTVSLYNPVSHARSAIQPLEAASGRRAVNQPGIRTRRTESA